MEKLADKYYFASAFSFMAHLVILEKARCAVFKLEFSFKVSSF